MPRKGITSKHVKYGQREVSTMNKLIPGNFPLLRTAARKALRFDCAIEQLNEGLSLGRIRNVTLQEAKRVLDSAVRIAWEQNVSDAYFSAGKWNNQPKAIQVLYNNLLVFGLRDIKRSDKRISDCLATGDAVVAMRAVIKEVLPLVMAVGELKGKTVKGRAPSSASATPVNQNKVLKTCAVCFRPIAVIRGHMAHHGYRRTGFGFQTASCPGVNFKPLEVSTEGLEWLISSVRNQYEQAEMEFNQRFSKEEIEVAQGERGGEKGRVDKIVRGSAAWQEHFEAYVNRLVGRINRLKNELEYLDLKLKTYIN